MKKLELKTLIREVVREEVQLEMRRILGENKSISTRIKAPKRTKPKSVIKEDTVKPNGVQPTMSTNPVLNEILQETARDAEAWPTLGGHTMTSEDMGTIVSRTVPEAGPNTAILNSFGTDPNRLPDHVTNALTKDYRGVMKKVDQKIAAKKV
jgi:metal-dependent amidase/aminoacylase/carboxypeptidase family protein